MSGKRKFGQTRPEHEYDPDVDYAAERYEWYTMLCASEKLGPRYLQPFSVRDSELPAEWLMSDTLGKFLIPELVGVCREYLYDPLAVAVRMHLDPRLGRPMILGKEFAYHWMSRRKEDCASISDYPYNPPSLECGVYWNGHDSIFGESLQEYRLSKNHDQDTVPVPPFARPTIDTAQVAAEFPECITKVYDFEILGLKNASGDLCCSTVWDLVAEIMLKSKQRLYVYFAAQVSMEDHSEWVETSRFQAQYRRSSQLCLYVGRTLDDVVRWGMTRARQDSFRALAKIVSPTG